jgi:intracellular multiplication protein IcmL
MPIKDAVSTVLNRNSFYVNGYRMLSRVCFIQTGVIVLLIISVVGLAATVRVKPIYFATTIDGRIINIVPLDEPYLTNVKVKNWVAKTIQDVMSFGYHDYEKHMDRIRNVFTIPGFVNFEKSLQEAKFVDSVKARRVVVGLEMRGEPEIMNEFVRNGIYTWDVKVPITYHFDGDQPPAPIVLDLILRIVRVSTLQNPDGIGIEQWISNSTAGQ